VAPRDLVLDLVAPLRYKRALDRPLAKSWVPEDAKARLEAYKLRAAYLENSARYYLADGIPDTDRRGHREYGDASLLVQRVVAGVLGEDVSIAVDGADVDLGDAPRLPPEPEPVPDDASDLEKRVGQIAQSVWEERARQAIDEWEQAWVDQPIIQAHQEWLRAWADDELLLQRVWEAENSAVGLADAVYVLAWSRLAGRPKLRIYDPGFYFPVLDDDAEQRGFPTRIHLAWETDEDGDGVTDHVRRITYELGPILPLTSDGELVSDEDGNLRLLDGDRMVEGQITRRYAWSDQDATTTCYLTDAKWSLEDLEDQKVDALSPERASYAIGEDGQELRRLDLRIDFLPVIHVPNTPSSQEHFGRSILDRVLQLLDDLSETDTDLQKASALAGTPMLGISGKQQPKDDIEVRPGAAWWLGEGGKLDSIDLSAPVKVLQGVVDDLLDRLHTNIQVPGVAVGRVDPARIASGILYQLSLSPFGHLIAMLRLVREPKYALMLKFVGRLAQAGYDPSNPEAGGLAPGELPTARLVFGPFLPQDLAAVVELVVKLLAAKAISRPSALRLLVQAGIDVESIADELEAIEHQDFEGAAELLDALGDEQAVADYLGRKVEGNPVPPPIEL
jgi:hypothetical protein